MLKKLLLIFIFLNYSFIAFATQPPTLEQLARYKKDGSLLKRIDQAKALGNYKFDQSFARKLQQRNQQLLTAQKNNKTITKNDANYIDPLDGYFPSTGSPKILVLLVEFPDYPHTDTNTREVVDNLIFGGGDADQFPNDSLTNFYKRSSYEQLNIQGNVLDWYKTDYDRPIDDGSNAWQVKQQVIKDAINYHDALGHDFSQYDNDGDGSIDYIAVIWTGPTGEWASLWWGTFSGFGDDTYIVDGKTINSLSWQQISYSYDEGGKFSPSTLIHETGHALGLPDYYDYDASIGPKGGVGGMDQMAGGNDHNAFSKYILGWITPDIVGSGAGEVSLLPSSTNANALLIMKDADASTKYDEFFMVEYRNKVKNDQNLPSEGLVIWHVDASLNQWGWFENDNSYSDNKFIRLVQADGLGEIEKNASAADAGDFYHAGNSFTPSSLPQSRDNAGLHTGVVVDNIVETAAIINFDAEIYQNVIDFTLPSINEHQVVHPNDLLNVNVVSGSVKTIELFIDDVLASTLVEPPYELTLSNDLMLVGQHQLRAVATNMNDQQSAETRNIMFLDGQQHNLYINLHSEKDQQLMTMLDKAEIETVNANFIFPLSVTDFALVHLNYGTANTPWVDVGGGSKTSTGVAKPATAEDILNIKNYLEQGGKLIIEGENVIGSTPDLQALLGINVTQIGLSTTSITGDLVYEEKNINVDVSDLNYPVNNDLLENAKGEANSILTANGQYYDWTASQWLEASGSCALSKTYAATAAKMVVASCLVSTYPKYEKALVYNNYLKALGVEKRVSTNIPPIVATGDDIVADERSNITLAATASDADNDTLTFSWQQLSGIEVVLTNSDTLTPTFTMPEVDRLTAQVIVLQLTVSDGKDSVVDTLNISINNVNRAPIVSTGSNQTIKEGNIVNLNASISDDDGDTLSYAWQQTSGATVTLTNSDSLSPSFSAPNVDNNTALIFELTVTDGVDEVKSSVTITVTNTVVVVETNKTTGGGSFVYLLLCLLLILFYRKTISINKLEFE